MTTEQKETKQECNWWDSVPGMEPFHGMTNSGAWFGEIKIGHDKSQVERQVMIDTPQGLVYRINCGLQASTGLIRHTIFATNGVKAGELFAGAKVTFEAKVTYSTDVGDSHMMILESFPSCLSPVGEEPVPESKVIPVDHNYSYRKHWDNLHREDHLPQLCQSLNERDALLNIPELTDEEMQFGVSSCNVPFRKDGLVIESIHEAPIAPGHHISGERIWDFYGYVLYEVRDDIASRREMLSHLFPEDNYIFRQEWSSGSWSFPRTRIHVTTTHKPSWLFDDWEPRRASLEKGAPRLDGTRNMASANLLTNDFLYGFNLINVTYEGKSLKHSMGAQAHPFSAMAHWPYQGAPSSHFRNRFFGTKAKIMKICNNNWIATYETAQDWEDVWAGRECVKVWWASLKEQANDQGHCYYFPTQVNGDGLVFAEIGAEAPEVVEAPVEMAPCAKSEVRANPQESACLDNERQCEFRGRLITINSVKCHENLNVAAGPKTYYRINGESEALKEGVGHELTIDDWRALFGSSVFGFSGKIQDNGKWLAWSVACRTLSPNVRHLYSEVPEPTPEVPGAEKLKNPVTTSLPQRKPIEPIDIFHDAWDHGNRFEVDGVSFKVVHVGQGTDRWSVLGKGWGNTLRLELLNSLLGCQVEGCEISRLSDTEYKWRCYGIGPAPTNVRNIAKCIGKKL